MRGIPVDLGLDIVGHEDTVCIYIGQAEADIRFRGLYIFRNDLHCFIQLFRVFLFYHCRIVFVAGFVVGFHETDGCVLVLCKFRGIKDTACLVGHHCADLGDFFAVSFILYFGDVWFIQDACIDLTALEGCHDCGKFTQRNDGYIVKGQAFGFQHPSQHVMEGGTFLGEAHSLSFQRFNGSEALVVLGGTCHEGGGRETFLFSAFIGHDEKFLSFGRHIVKTGGNAGCAYVYFGRSGGYGNRLGCIKPLGIDFNAHFFEISFIHGNKKRCAGREAKHAQRHLHRFICLLLRRG